MLVSVAAGLLLCAGVETHAANQGSSPGSPPASYLISTFAGGLPTPAPAVATSYPLLAVNAVAIDPAGAVFLSSLNSVFKLDSAGNLVLVAGVGRAGYSGDGGPALAAQLNSPKGLAFDLAGNLYIADSLNERVRRVSTDGVISTVAGTGIAGDSGDNGTAVSAQLDCPQDVAIDSAGNLYIADSRNHRVRRVSEGIITTVAGKGQAGDSGDGNPATSAHLDSPQGVAVDLNGNLYIADTGNNRVRRVSNSGVIETVAGSASAHPAGVAVDPAGNLYIADTGGHRIREVSGGTISTIAGSGGRGFRGDGGAALDAQFDSPSSVAVDSAGNVYVADSQNRRVRKIASIGRSISTVAGTVTMPSSGDGGRASLAQFSNTSRMAVAAGLAGNVYFTDNGNHRVRMVALDGTVSTLAGFEFVTATGLATDPAGNLYVADAGSCKVYKVDTVGVVSPFAGNGACSAAEGGPDGNASMDPYGLAFDSSGNLYVADRRNNRVREISPNGRMTTVAGTGAAGYSGDGGLGVNAKLASPTGLAVDSAGNLYIADSANSVVRILSTAGVMSTFAGKGIFGYAGDGGSAIDASLSSPQGLAVDPAGDVFIVDAAFSTVRRVSTNGVIGTIAGVGRSGYSGDAGPAADAQLSAPSDIALGPAGNLYVADRLNNAIRILQPENSQPLLSVSSVHTGNLAAGQAGATYTVTVSNAALGSATRGIVTVGETLSAGLTLVSMSGAGWSCSNTSCRREDPLTSGSSYPPIVVTANVSPNAPSQVSSVVDVSGGGSAGASAMDAADVTGPQILSVIVTHRGNFVPGQAGAYSITVTNRGTAATVGTVAVTDSLPAGLTVASMAGPGWTCTPAALTCTRSESLRPGARYPSVRVAVNAAADASDSIANTAAVWGGTAATASVRNPTAVAPSAGRKTTAVKILHPNIIYPLQITTLSVPAATQYQSYSTTLSASGGTPPYIWSVDPTTGVSLPEGMTLDPATGIVSATQVHGQGGYEINVLVTDSSSPAPNVANSILDFGVYSDDSYGGCPMFPPDSIFNQRIDTLPVDTNASHQIPSSYSGAKFHPDFGSGFYPGPGGIPFMRVPANQPSSSVNLSGDGQIDAAGTYDWPFPAWLSVVVEGTSYGQYGDDHHILILQSSTNSINAPQTGQCTLFETYSSIDVPSMYDAPSNTWSLGAGLHYHLNSDEIARSTDTLDTGAQDSDGMPILPLLIRYSEVPLGVKHPLRITLPSPTNSWVWPGTGCCSGSGPPQGLLYRLKASVNWQAACPVNTNPQAATILQALQQYGAYMSDHGSAGYMEGVPDIRWNDDDLACIKQFHLTDMEVVDNSMLEISPISGQTMPYVAPATLPDGTVGTTYATALSEVGGAPSSLQWTVSSGALPAGLTLDGAGNISGTPSSSAGSPFSFAITVTDTASGYASQPQSFSIAVSGSGAPAPDLTVASTHTGNFSQGQTGASYSLTVSNIGTQPTSGSVTISDVLPAGLTATAIGGSGWSCTLATLTCTRSDALSSAGSYPAVTLTVTVAATAGASLSNTAAVWGGGETNTSNDQAVDPTTVVQLSDLVVTSSHTGNFTLGQTGATYSLVATNIGPGPTTAPVTVTDTLPTGLTATAISGQGWTCTLVSLSCTRTDPITTGVVYQAVTVTVTVASNAPASVTNIATVSGGGESTTTNDQSTDPTTIVQTAAPDLTVTGTHTGNFTQGQTGASYTIVVTNSGGASTSGSVTVSDNLPSGLTATSLAGAGWSCTLATLTCTRSDALSPSGSYPLTLTLTVAANAAASLTNVATVSGGDETNTSNDQATDVTTIVQPPDLTVSSSHSGNFSQGQVGATYAIGVTNSGNGPTVGTVTVTDTLPAGLTATSIGGSGWTCTLATVTCSRSDVLPSGGTVSLAVTVTVAANAVGSVTNVVTVSGGSEINTSNDQASDLTTVTQSGSPDLTVSSSHVGSFSQGQVGASYSLMVTNAGSGPTSGSVTVADALPTGLTATAISGTGWNCTLATVTCTRSDVLSSGGSYPLAVTVTVSSNAAASVTNTATVSGGGEINTSNDQASDVTTIVQLPDLMIGSSHAGNFTQGQIGAIYSITLTNAGAGPTSGTVTVSDSLPAGLTATAIAGTGWSCTLATLTCMRNDALSGGASFPNLSLTVTVSSNAAASLTNTATVSGGGEINTSNDQASDVITIVQLPDLTVTSTHTGNFTQGQIGAIYSINVTNAGAGPTSGTVTVSDSLPAGLTATAISGNGWNCTLATLTCTRSDVLSSGGSYPLAVTVTVSSNAAASVTNTATVSGGGEINTSNDQASDVTTIVQLPDLTVTSTHTGNFTQGQIGAIYSITVTNAGAGPTSGTVTVSDSLPAGLTATAIAGTGWTCTLATLTCTRNDALSGGASFPLLSLTVTVAANASPSVTNSATAWGGGEINTSNDQATDVTTVAQLPDLIITSSHGGNFTQGQIGATYSITVTNSGTVPTTGTVTITDSLPAGLTATAIAGTGWTCTFITLTCARNDALSAGASFPLVVLTVNVAATAADNICNTATVSTSNSAETPFVATDSTTVNTIPAWGITATSPANFVQGQTGSYVLTATNSGTAPTNGTLVTVIDTLPAGLTASSIGGTGWTCNLGAVSCTRSDVLNSNQTASAQNGPHTVFDPVPFSSTTGAVRYQQVFSSSVFTAPADLRSLGFSLSANCAFSGNVTLRLTTTSAAVGSLSSALDANFTVPLTTVLSNPALSQSVTGGSESFGLVLPFSVPYHYDPAAGNLLVDMLLDGQSCVASGGQDAGGASRSAAGAVASQAVSAAAAGTYSSPEALRTAITFSDPANPSSYPPVTVMVNIAADALSSVTNAVSVSGGGATAVNYSDPTAIVQLPSLTVSETADSTTVAAGSAIGYTASVTNSAVAQTGSATSVTLSDPLPPASAMSWSISPAYNGPGICVITGAAGSQSLGCNFGGLTAGTTVSVHVSATTSPLNCAAYSNIATVSAANSSPLQGSATLTVQCPTLSISAPSLLPSGKAGTAYSATVSASGGTGVYTWSATGFPAGLAIDSNTGAIVGTPSAGGSFTVQVSVMDSNSVKASRSYALAIASTNLCDVNQDGVVNVLDLQSIINEALGLAAPLNDLNHDGVVNVLDVQLVINAILGMGCATS